MAQTKRKRRSKHRGTAAGTIEARGRTGRKATPEERKKSQGKQSSAERRAERMNRPPSWRSAANRAAIAAVILVVVSIFLLNQPVGTALGFGAFALLFYIPLGYYMDSFMYKRRQAAAARGKK
ncbi:MAG TPA: hypothetical protein VK279_04290 [Solirubrobacteraceae bacterium]|nr:hypothetical protein [Solirubrobacteraceae bacterium]